MLCGAPLPTAARAEKSGLETACGMSESFTMDADRAARHESNPYLHLRIGTPAVWPGFAGGVVAGARRPSDVPGLVARGAARGLYSRSRSDGVLRAHAHGHAAGYAAYRCCENAE